MTPEANVLAAAPSAVVDKVSPESSLSQPDQEGSTLVRSRADLLGFVQMAKRHARGGEEKLHAAIAPLYRVVMSRMSDRIRFEFDESSQGRRLTPDFYDPVREMLSNVGITMARTIPAQTNCLFTPILQALIPQDTLRTLEGNVRRQVRSQITKCGRAMEAAAVQGIPPEAFHEFLKTVGGITGAYLGWRRARRQQHVHSATPKGPQGEYIGVFQRDADGRSELIRELLPTSDPRALEFLKNVRHSPATAKQNM